MNDTTTPKTIEIDLHADGVCCNGGDGALGHPKVWYSFNDNSNSAQCSYCDRIFTKKT